MLLERPQNTDEIGRGKIFRSVVYFSALDRDWLFVQEGDNLRQPRAIIG